jgi:beta-glucanase (GH16 family)
VLVWHDEFNQDGPLSAEDWSHENGFVRNQEAQWYQPENAVCKDGYLVIEARRETKPNPRYVAAAGATAPATATAAARRGERGGRGGVGWPNLPTIAVTSASVNTRGKHEWTYGRLEIRARIDTRLGSWPAFWTLGVTGGWPANGEVDIMEYYRGTMLANVAWGGASGAMWNTGRTALDKLPADFAEKFHTWRMDWDAAAIKLYRDEELVNQQDLSQTVNVGRQAGVNPFVNRPVYLLLNQAIGGTQGGDYAGTEFPVRFYVDYVRVWQKEGAGTRAAG